MLNPPPVPEKGLAVRVEQPSKQAPIEQARLPVGVESNPDRDLEKALSIEQGPAFYGCGPYAIVKT